MIEFTDGPAAGVTLALRRAPVLLRVVRGRTGEWDALDQPGDEPKATESIFVYLLDSPVTGYHLCIRGKGRAAGGFYSSASYRLLPGQPADGDVRGRDAWASWCHAERQRVLAALKPELRAAVGFEGVPS